MKRKSMIMYLIIVIVLIAKTEAKGGRGGGGRGRSGGGSRSSSSGGSHWSSFGGSSKTGSSFSTGKSGHSGTNHRSNTGGFFQGLFHSSPYDYSYRPVHISGIYHTKNTQPTTSYINAEQTYSSKSETDNSKVEQTAYKKENGNNTDTPNYTSGDAIEHAVGFTISQALSSDFFSIFNMVNDISKYPTMIKNKEFLQPTSTTTTSSTSTTATTTTTTTEKPESVYETQTSTSTPFLKQGGSVYNSELFPTTENTRTSIKDGNIKSEESIIDLHRKMDEIFINSLLKFDEIDSDYIYNDEKGFSPLSGLADSVGFQTPILPLN